MVSILITSLGSCWVSHSARPQNIYWFSLEMENIYWLCLDISLVFENIATWKGIPQNEVCVCPTSSFFFCFGLLRRPAFQPLMSSSFYPCCYRKSITFAHTHTPPHTMNFWLLHSIYYQLYSFTALIFSAEQACKAGPMSLNLLFVQSDLAGASEFRIPEREKRGP